MIDHFDYGQIDDYAEEVDRFEEEAVSQAKRSGVPVKKSFGSRTSHNYRDYLDSIVED